MKTIFKLSFLASIAIGISSCSEIGPSITLTAPTGRDTTYIEAIAAPQPHVVLMEEFTGVKCVNCPTAHKALENLIATNPGRVNVVSIQPFGNALANPKKDHTRNDNRSEDGTQLSQIYNKVGALPTAGVDRSPINGSFATQLAMSEWSARVNDRLPINNGVNVSISSMERTSSNDILLTVKVSFTKNVDKQLSLMVALTESKVIDYQEDFTGDIEDYEHNHLLRDILSPITGFPMLNDFPTKEAGRVFEKTIVIDKSTANNWNYANMEAVAYVIVNAPDDHQVLQSSAVKIK